MRKMFAYAIIIVMIGGMFYYYTTLGSGPDINGIPVKDAVNRNLFTEDRMMELLDDHLASEEFVSAVKDTPDQLVRANALVRKIMYSRYDELTEDEVENLLQMQRSLFAEELQDKNPLSVHMIRVKQDIENFKTAEIRIIGYDTLAPEYQGDNNDYVVIKVIFYTNIPDRDIYSQYALKKDMDDQWGIYGWGQAEEFVITQ